MPAKIIVKLNDHSSKRFQHLTEHFRSVNTGFLAVLYCISWSALQITTRQLRIQYTNSPPERWSLDLSIWGGGVQGWQWEFKGQPLYSWGRYRISDDASFDNMKENTSSSRRLGGQCVLQSWIFFSPRWHLDCAPKYLCLAFVKREMCDLAQRSLLSFSLPSFLLSCYCSELS